MISNIPDAFLESMAQKFQMLGDPSRLRILKALMADELNVTAIVQETGLSQANVSKHLRLLASAGLVHRRKVGTSVFYALYDPVVERICTLVCETILGESKRMLSKRRPSSKRRKGSL